MLWPQITMLHKRVICFMTVIVSCLPAFSSQDHKLDTGPGQDFSVYFLKTDHPLSIYDSASFTSIEDIILAHNHEKKFLGDFDRYGRKAVLSESEYGTSSEDKCRYNNGNCSQICETIQNEAICSCEEGFSLVDGTDCHLNASGNFFLSGTSGRFLMDEEDRIWTIKAPDTHIIELEISRYHGLDQHYYMKYDVYESRFTEQGKLSPYDTSRQVQKFISHGPYLYVRTRSGWNVDGTFGAYKTGLPYYRIHSRNELVLPQLKGLRCYSITYSGYLSVYSAKDGYSRTALFPQMLFMHHKSQWTTSVFQTIFRQENGRLFFEFSSESKVLMLRQCLDIEHPVEDTGRALAVCYNGGTWNWTIQQCNCEEGFSGKYCENGVDVNCENGGVFNAAKGSCICPPGFIGTFCEEGCGPNAYGKNCEEICSILSNECQGAIFCRENGCTCAPGFYGRRCDSPCKEGQYGASCHQYCGKCYGNATCDRYTGKCYSFCEPGYYPPLCQETYKTLKSAPEILETGYRHLKIRAELKDQSGRGHPKFYEVQYKAENDASWLSLTPRKISNEAEIIIDNLLAGHFYSVRIILIDQDGGSCELNVPESKAMTKCIEPQRADYSLAAKEISENEIAVEWSYFFDRNADFCLVKDFELSLISRNRQLIFTNLPKDGSKTLSGLLPNTAYRIQLTGITRTANRIPSQEITVHTLPNDLGAVVNVEVVPLDSSHKLKLTWQPPRKSAGLKLKYRITYTCVRVLACNNVDNMFSTQDTVVETTSVLLKDLLPHTLYQIEIAALTADGVSEGYFINTTTEHTVPQVAPTAADCPVSGVTNVSASVTWLPPRECALLNGYLYGYSYKLVDIATRQVVKENTVQENVQFVNLTNLEPDHCYEVKIAVVSSGGVDLSNTLDVPFCTSPTAPGPVQFLKAYKRSRKMVGLKWGRPLHTYGEISSFLISYSEEGTDKQIKWTVTPEHCRAWTDLYCHTISHLSPARKYSFTVQARNDKVNADGDPATIQAITAEGVSTAPVNLKVVNATENSVTLEWQLPDNINGNLRSFIIMTGQVDTKGASDECCDSIPLVDYQVNSEEPSYRYEISGLSPASTYSMTVAAKTLTLGEEARITAQTQPSKEVVAKD